MRRDLLILVTLIVVGSALVGSTVLFWRHINRTRVVAEAITADDVAFKVTQSFNRSLGEPFTTSFYYRKPGNTHWNSRYYCHEDWYWGHGSVELDEPAKTATIYRDGKPTIRFNWATEIYTQLSHTQGGGPITNGPEPFAAYTNSTP